MTMMMMMPCLHLDYQWFRPSDRSYSSSSLSPSLTPFLRLSLGWDDYDHYLFLCSLLSLFLFLCHHFYLFCLHDLWYSHQREHHCHCHHHRRRHHYDSMMTKKSPAMPGYHLHHLVVFSHRHCLYYLAWRTTRLSDCCCRCDWIAMICEGVVPEETIA